MAREEAFTIRYQGIFRSSTSWIPRLSSVYSAIGLEISTESIMRDHREKPIRKADRARLTVKRVREPSVNILLSLVPDTETPSAR